MSHVMAFLDFAAMGNRVEGLFCMRMYSCVGKGEIRGFIYEIRHSTVSI